MRFVTSAAGLVLVALVLGGCVRQPPPVVPTSTPSVAPVFATDADALAAAKTAYTGYLAVTDLVGNQGGSDATRIAPFVTSAWLPHELGDYRALAKLGESFDGRSRWTYFKIQDRSQSASGIAEVHAYVCVDVSKSVLLDSKGRDITPKNRVDFFPSVVDLQGRTSGSSVLLFGGSEPWTGANFCR
jgi:hypothetical protein